MEGQTVRFTDGVGTVPPDYEIGAEVKVLYDPDDARNAQVVSWKRLWLGPTLLICAGLVPILVGMPVIWLSLRRRRFSSRFAF
jgi:hypothetical protein